VYVASAAVMYLYASQKSRSKKRRHRVEISKYLHVRPQYGAYNSLMHDLPELDTTKFRNYIMVRVRVVMGLDLGFGLGLVRDSTVYCSDH